ncbi:MAG: hypothetical protein KatS3mg105_1190 [Gemmatales bacterium]|nr:MAG: hypothetical protein KatS3mg105_1190 [Gemmatales bacterium]
MHPFDHHDREHLLGRRQFLQAASLAGMSWLTPLGEMLARQAERKRQPAQSLIVLWLAGGPSQLETFDPHPGTLIGGETKAIKTSVKGVQIAEGLPRLAEEMHSIALVRSLMSKEGDHERGTYFMKTGHRPDPTVVHPSIGAIICHELPVGKTEIPRHISIFPGAWPARGGYLGGQYDAFKTYDPLGPVPDLRPRVPPHRDERRMESLAVVDRAFSRGRASQVRSFLIDDQRRAARTMMSSEQIKAFDVSLEPEKQRLLYGDTPFGRGCLAARRLIEVGVRCVEVTLSGWDSHANNFEIHKNLNEILDPAFAGLLRDLRERNLLDKTIVLCAGEFGRTPKINPASGRDHWPTGFSVALAGGGIRGGVVVGATDPQGGPQPEDPRPAHDVHATILHALGIDYGQLRQTPIGRTVRHSIGTPIKELIDV